MLAKYLLQFGDNVLKSLTTTTTTTTTTTP